MSITDQLTPFVKNNPLVLIRLDIADSTSLRKNIEKKEYFTYTKPHAILNKYQKHAICLIELKSDEETECYMGIITHKARHATLNTIISIRRIHRIFPDSLSAINQKAKLPQIEKMPQIGNYSSLSAELSICFLRAIEDAYPMDNSPSQHYKNAEAMNVALDYLNTIHAKGNSYMQILAVNTALNIFGIPNHNRGKIRLLEDDVIEHDKHNLPGFDKIKPYVTGYSIHKKTKTKERLIVYMANKRPLEEMLGVDLIYINEVKGNIVMVQYKMLEGKKNCSFRVDEQLKKEIKRMKIPKHLRQLGDYRLNSTPFFFQFVKRFTNKDKTNPNPPNYIISLEHFNEILLSPEGKGPQGGALIKEDTLKKRCLHRADLVNLISSGYIGTYRLATDALKTMIQRVAEGDRAIVAAWHQKIGLNSTK